jgi:anaerobic selenocysteine-containing dehydrogenase
MYDGIQRLAKAGDHVQYGGARLCEGGTFPTADGRAHFAAVDLPRLDVPDGMFLVATRRGKQFNSMVHERRDALTGAARDSVLISEEDARRLGIQDGDPVVVHNIAGEVRGQAYIAPVQPGTLQVHWPEGNVLVDRRKRSPIAGIPDYNAVARLDPVAAAPAGMASASMAPKPA